MEESYKKVSFQEAKHIIDTEPNCVILDVRDEDEYITGHAENAVLFPVDTIDEDTAEEKIPTLDTPILVYCKSGRRSFMAAMKLGLNVVKFFPAGVYGGLKAMKSLSAPFGGIKFIPTGGVDAKNLKEYLEAPFVHAVGGSWLCPKKEIAAGNFDAVTALCREASEIVKEVRG